MPTATKTASVPLGGAALIDQISAWNRSRRIKR